MKALLKIKTGIGLDIGAHSIKLVEVRRTSKGVFLTGFAIKELPLEAMGEERNAGVIAETIKGLFHEKNIKKVTIGISGPRVAMRRVSLPSMPKKELKQAVRWEARKFISFPLEKAIIDFQVLGEKVEEGARKADLMVAAAEMEFIENQLAILKEAGLEPVGIGTIPHALWHTMEMTPEKANEGFTALIDIGATKTSINIVKDNRLQFTREITTAGNAFTEAIKEATALEGIALDFAKAEEIKKKYGMPKEDDPERTEDQVPLRKISFVMRPVLERLLSEINRSFEFYKGQSKEEKVGRIFISGGSARLKGLREYLADQLGTEAQLLTPLKDMEPALAVAAGLALGRAKEINFLPEEYRLVPKILLQKYSPVVLACLVFCVLFGMYLNVNVRCTRYRKALTLKEAQLAGLQSARARIAQLEETKKRLEQEKALFPKVSLEQPAWGEILKEVSCVIPEKTTLTGLFLRTKETAKELRLKGVAFGGDTEIVGSIAEVMEGLEKSPFFSDVRLSSSEENQEYSEHAANFELVCKITQQTQ